jgi:CubicO group peptidase (beta-lactamase class C family)
MTSGGAVNYRKTVVILLLSWLSMSARADDVDTYIAAQMRQLHIPGVSLAVVRDGRIIKLRGYGLANVELGAPVSQDTVFEIGSITKQFTAAAVMMLVEEGRVDLDEKISKYLVDVPEAWSSVTIRHLLTHSSGIQNYLLVPGLFEATTRPQSHDDIAHLFFARLQQLDFQPGETWAYSNTGYLLLGNVIEKVSGKSYWDFLDERIFQPLGMGASRSGEPATIIKGRAAGYEWTGNSLKNRAALTENAYGAGSIVSTAGDLAKWDEALYGEKVLKRSSLNQMWTPAKAAGGAIAPFNYGFGWFVDTYHGHHVVAHTGGTPGFSSAIYRFTDDKLTVILLTNHADRVIDHLAIDVAGVYVPELARPKGLEPDPDARTSAILKKALADLCAGKADPSQFTAAMQIFLKTAMGKEIWPWLCADGEIRSFTLGERERRGDWSILRYKTVMGNTTRWFSFTVTAEGKIAQINWW